jgi:L-amino acid N-acyltransferase YncA
MKHPVMNPSPMLVRPCEPQDIPAIAAIYAHHVLHGLATFEEEPPSAEEMTRRRAAIIAGGYSYLVAERAGDVLGYAYASAYRPRPAYRYAVENSVYIRHDRVGQGIGKVLLDRLIAECEARGFRQMIAVIGDSGNEASIGLHRGAGFTMIGTIRSCGFKFGRWVDTVLMQRALGPGDSTLPDTRGGPS